jgi:ZIP family zinc transporter
LTPVLTVFLYGLVTAVATGLGALPFLFLGRVSPRAVASANAVACGLMLGASFGIVAEGTGYGAWQTLAGGLLGVLFILATQHWLGDPDAALTDAGGADARRMFLIVVVMTVHSFAEGVAVGVSFGGGATLALAITLAIAVHNIPEGLAISAVLRPRGKTVLACIGWSIFSSLPQPLMAVPAFLFVDAFSAALPYGLGFAAGAMVFMVLEELLPEAYDHARRPMVAIQVSLTLVAMVLFQQYL